MYYLTDHGNPWVERRGSSSTEGQTQDCGTRPDHGEDRKWSTPTAESGEPVTVECSPTEGKKRIGRLWGCNLRPDWWGKGRVGSWVDRGSPVERVRRIWVCDVTRRESIGQTRWRARLWDINKRDHRIENTLKIQPSTQNGQLKKVKEDK